VKRSWLALKHGIVPYRIHVARFGVVIRATTNVYDECASVTLRPVLELHAFAVVYVRFANVYDIHAVVWRPGAFECG
jgi:hypothetical protein